MISKSVCVLGLGYIGLPTAALLANRGYKTIGVDVNAKTVETINAGKVHIVEPELDTFLRAAVESGNLKAYTKPQKADIYIIAVPTPFKEHYVPDLSYIEAATDSIVNVVEPENLIILESTSPIGTTEKVKERLESKGVDTEHIYFAHCPERVLPGHIMRELIENDRIVGGLNSNSTKEAVRFYKTFVQGKIIETDAKTAEMTKLAENAFRDINIAYANELSMICEKLGIHSHELISLANHHPRVNILQPGPGVGGHCIAVDPWFLIHGNEPDAKLMRQAREVNTNKTLWVVEHVNKEIQLFYDKNKRKPNVVCMGLTYKANIDDLRESPALDIAKQLQKNRRCNLYVCEPNVNEVIGFESVSTEDALTKADLLVFLVKHNEFCDISRSEISRKEIIDTIGLFL